MTSLNGQASASASPLGLHRVREPAGVLPQAAWRLAGTRSRPAVPDSRAIGRFWDQRRGSMSIR